LDLLGGLWHVLNFYAAALGLGLVASLAAKLLWSRELGHAAWWRMWVWSSGTAAVIAVAGLVVLGRDGKMLTYGAMVLGCALSLWWAGFVRR
jgi:hypothetical protein